MTVSYTLWRPSDMCSTFISVITSRYVTGYIRLMLLDTRGLGTSYAVSRPWPGNITLRGVRGIDIAIAIAIAIAIDIAIDIEIVIDINIDIDIDIVLVSILISFRGAPPLLGIVQKIMKDL